MPAGPRPLLRLHLQRPRRSYLNHFWCQRLSWGAARFHLCEIIKKQPVAKEKDRLMVLLIRSVIVWGIKSGEDLELSITAPAASLTWRRRCASASAWMQTYAWSSDGFLFFSPYSFLVSRQRFCITFTGRWDTRVHAAHAGRASLITPVQAAWEWLGINDFYQMGAQFTGNIPPKLKLLIS